MTFSEVEYLLHFKGKVVEEKRVRSLQKKR